MKKPILLRISLWIQALLYLGAGINHFINPSFYLPLIPSYLSFPYTINIITGVTEILLGLGLIMLPKHRRTIAVLIILFLIVILPAHFYHLTEGGCLSNGFCTPVWACWLRIILQFLLMGWAWSVRKIK